MIEFRKVLAVVGLHPEGPLVRDPLDWPCRIPPWRRSARPASGRVRPAARRPRLRGSPGSSPPRRSAPPVRPVECPIRTTGASSARAAYKRGRKPSRTGAENQYLYVLCITVRTLAKISLHSNYEWRHEASEPLDNTLGSRPYAPSPRVAIWRHAP